ncbi:MAG TPA: adenine phosphoribosyltransferase [Gemmatimonadaceae bacterium]|nr:adenine phosphoribosyltransferase [Gemmatimonadaceae bacterium]
MSPSKDIERALRARIRDVPDFPKPGILFKDITPVLLDAALFRRATDAMASAFAGDGITHVVAIESRGFLFGAPIAQQLAAGLVPVRKPGKLPHTSTRIEYALEYGTDALEMHSDAVREGDRVLLVDDVLATGGTARATCELIERHDAKVVGCAFLIGLSFLPGLSALTGRRVETLVTY